MADMLPYVQVVPEMDMALDPLNGVIGGAVAGGVLVSLDDVNEQISRVEDAAEELMQSLNPYSAPLGSFAGREGAYATAGKWTNIVYGFIIGLIISFALITVFNNVIAILTSLIAVFTNLGVI